MFKLLLVGDSGVGKTTFAASASNCWHSDYFPESRRNGVYWLAFCTNFGPIRFECFDIAGSETIGNASEHMQAQCAIIMFDVTSPTTFQNVVKWYREITRVCGEIPIVVCGNKIDLNDRRTRASRLNFDGTISLPFFELTAIRPEDDYLSTESDLLEPIQWLSRKLCWQALGAGQEDHVMIVQPPSYDLPPMGHLSITPEQLAQLEAENAAAISAVPLPDEDEDL